MQIQGNGERHCRDHVVFRKKDQTGLIENWLHADIPHFSYSGYYCYDEQVVYIAGKKAYRLTLFDSVLNVPVGEKIAFKLGAEPIQEFLQEMLKEHPVYGITTDDKKYYRKIIQSIGAVHQLCKFHYLKRVKKETKWHLKRKSLSNAKKMQTVICVSLLREAFRFFTVKDFEHNLDKVIDMIDTVPYRIKK